MRMRIAKKTLLRTSIISAALFPIIWLGIFSILWGIYGCVGQTINQQCPALNSAQTKIHVAMALGAIDVVVFAVSFGLYIRYTLKRKT